MKHGHCKKGKRTKEWMTWHRMIARCKYPSVERYPQYGGRGIKVCERWLNSFTNFINDVGYAPSEKHSIDRIDNDGDYEPNNVKWSTNSQQIKNSSRARMITFDGVTLNLCDWVQKTGIKRSTIQMRLDKYKWSIEKTLTTIKKN